MTWNLETARYLVRVIVGLILLLAWVYAILSNNAAAAATLSSGTGPAIGGYLLLDGSLGAYGAQRGS